MRWLFLLGALFGLACGNADAPCKSCTGADKTEQAQPTMSSRELDEQLDEIEREIAGDGGPR